MKDEIGKGVIPEIDILVYEGIDQYGCKFYCRAEAWKLDPNGGLRRAWVLHPDYGLEEMTADMGRLGSLRPIRCVTQESVDRLVAEGVKAGLATALSGILDQIAVLQARVAEHEAILAKARAKAVSSSKPIAATSNG